MNIYEKLTQMRLALQAIEIKKSGRNEFAKYDYMELGDFLPHINSITAEHKVACVVSFASDAATLTLVDAEKTDDTIVFASPMSTASLKGCHDVQNLGAAQTYLRRYLYTNAFEIVEHDALDAGQDAGDVPKEQKSQQTPLRTQEQMDKILALGRDKGITQADIAKVAIKEFRHGLDDLTHLEAEALLTRLGKATPKEAS